MIMGRKQAEKITANTDCFLWKRNNDSETKSNSLEVEDKSYRKQFSGGKAEP